MRAGSLNRKITFYSKTTTRDTYSSSLDDWDTKAFDTKGGIRHIGGSKDLNENEKFYSKSIELTVRYRADILENMQLTIDDETDRYIITYIEEIGRRKGLILSIEKINL